MSGYHTIPSPRPSFDELRQDVSPILGPSDGYKVPTEKHTGYLSSSVGSEKEIDLHGDGCITHGPQLGQAWRPGFWVRFPTVGILALFGTLVAAAVAMVTLVLSNGKVVGTWAGGIPPNTFLAISALFSNMFIAVSFAQGLVLSYWRLCLQGTSVEGLHHSWNAGQSMLGACVAVLKGHGYSSALALVLMTLSAVRSPINQAATNIANSTPQANGTMDLWVAPRIPDNILATIGSSRTSGVTRPSSLTQNFSSIVRDYSTRAPITLDAADCGDVCDITINTFGFCASCESETLSVKPLEEAPEPNSFSTYFSTDMEYWIQGNRAVDYNNYYAGLILRVYYVTGRDSEGVQTRVNRTCHLQPSEMAVQVTITRDNKTRLQGHWSDDECGTSLNYTVPTAGWSPPDTTIGGFLYVMQDFYASSASWWNRGSASAVEFSGLTANQYVASGSGADDLVWSDPTDDILDTLRELSFRTSIFAAAHWPKRSPNSLQSLRFTSSTLKSIYVTRWAYMVAGFVIATLGVTGVALLYYRWWELGRDVSMSPIELAHAFSAPLLQDVDGNAQVKVILEQVGSRNVRYGEVPVADGRKDRPNRLRFDDAETVEKPRLGEVYR